MAFSNELLLLLITLATGAFAVFRAIHFQKKSRSLSGQLVEVSGNLESIQHNLRELQQKYGQSLEFNQNLSDAGITTRLQSSRLSLQTRPDAPEAPERYRYVHRLAGSGMAAEEIASVLSISSYEARQLVSLSRLGQNRQAVVTNNRTYSAHDMDE